jgi:soluble lytic murein transglycosylase-like protein
MRLCLPLALAGALLAQSPEKSAPTPRAAVAARQAAAVAKQEASIARQRLALQRQSEPGSAGTGETFFTAPWPRPPLWNAEPVAPAAPIARFSFDCPPLAAAEVDGLVGMAADREGLSPGLLRAVIRRESGFRPCAVSSKGAQGLMQLMPATSAWLGVRNPFDPVQNIEAGSRFLKSLLERYGGDLSLALGAYNAGPARVDQFGGVPPYPETRGYVASILGEAGEP